MIDAAAKERRWLIVADDPGYETKSLVSLVDRMLTKNKDSKALFIARMFQRPVGRGGVIDSRQNSFLNGRFLSRRTRRVRVARFAPSFLLLRQLQRGTASIDEMSWRDFEKS